MGDWVAANKGAGPWDFIPQPEKCGYVNNPRWTGAPASQVIHEPCGYWPKSAAASTAANLYGLTSSNQEIWAVYYAGDSLQWVSSYDSPIDANGLAFYGDNLLTVAGAGATAVLRELSTPTLSLVADHSVLVIDDLPTVGSDTTILYASDIEKYFVIGSGEHGRIIRFSKTLAKEARGFTSTVTTGTDGHLYVCKTHSLPDWRAEARPITGGSWNTYWIRIDDDVCDGPITAWGVGYSYPTYGYAPSATYHNGYLYVTLNQTTTNRAIRKIDPSTLEIVAYVNRLNAGRILGYGNQVYVLVGLTNATVYAYAASDLSQVAVSITLPNGKFVGGGTGDIIVVNGQLIVTTVPHTGDSAVYVLDPTTLAIVSETIYPAGLYQRLARIDDRTVVLAENNGVGICDLTGLRVPASAGELQEEADPPFLLFSAHSYTGFGQQHVLVAPVTESGAGIPTSDYCGTSPVWTVPA